ncbi:bifunctional precorrin-2 dehydrogenase/sirohydrochlorin ferrochelatase [Cohnella lubricantis]|uniref:precorrin-2 dehydrogenase n=1 Tax=Cohnella lubricantis TaxID=2163172 RepID=A0A841TBU2_9BACL|nr:bifunctional precorrin-2 dehydrogenase/sirohydrochlorin ferrochelatase [Cohnella lubricantis]MBB6677596.1 bifunctional precorrin-2 dehydrogenase/sirohydrochlorin ferrochelatase [Cohnella lubricantis]MBP2116517.1 precorrin-2 dehydrogenase/sirohydrochlorin ferrochelatase [Cohnella lubricantis]
MNGYPIMLDLKDKPVLIAGGGAVAERKAAALLEAGGDVTVVAPSVSPRLREWADRGRIRLAEREAREEDLAGAALFFAATDDAEANRRLAEAARARGVWTNVGTDGEAGDFVTPAVVRRGDLVLAVSASAAGPALAARVARELGQRYGPDYAHAAAVLRAVRRAAKACVGDAAERRRLLAASATDEALAMWREASPDEPPERLVERLRQLPGHAEG